MASVFGRFFSVSRMVKPEDVAGEIPSSRIVYHDLSRIAVPSVIEMVFMSLIGSVDTVMIGNLGYEAIAAVGLVGQPRMLMLSLFFALNIGVTAVVARRKGEGRKEEANHALRNAMLVIMALSVVVTAASLAWSQTLIKLAGAKEDTLNMAVQYFRIMSYFLPASALTMCINAAQRGAGNTRITLMVNLTANIVNVIFNYLLIYGHFGFPRLEVEGAAWASGIGICVGLALCIASLFVKKFSDGFLRLSLKDDWRLRKNTLGSIMKVGGNAMVEQGALRIGFFAYAAIVANLGTEAFAAHQVGMQFLSLSFTFGDGLAVAGTSLVGQMLGQKRPDMASIYSKCCQRLALCASIAIASTVAILRFQLAGIFLDASNPSSLEPFLLAADIMLMVALFQPVQMQSVVTSGCLRGAGDNLYVAMIMIICVVVIRPILSCIAIFAFGFGLFGAWSASLVDMTIRMSLMYRRFNSNVWQTKKV
ncbi:MAG: MATE family efflux transporter [Clostridiales bacterium]|nr:MATE family efflux transporter [Clostridiales bacterium]